MAQVMLHNTPVITNGPNVALCFRFCNHDWAMERRKLLFDGIRGNLTDVASAGIRPRYVAASLSIDTSIIVHRIVSVIC